MIFGGMAGVGAGRRCGVWLSCFRVFVMCRRHEYTWYFVHAILLYFCNLFNSGLKDF